EMPVEDSLDIDDESFGVGMRGQPCTRCCEEDEDMAVGELAAVVHPVAVERPDVATNLAVAVPPPETGHPLVDDVVRSRNGGEFAEGIGVDEPGGGVQFLDCPREGAAVGTEQVEAAAGTRACTEERELAQRLPGKKG